MGFISNSQEDSDNDISDINVTPFVDVLLVLLLIFMITAPLITYDIPIKLPSEKSKTPEKFIKTEEVIITLTKDDRLFVDSALIAPEKFIEQLEQIKLEAANPVIYMQADEQVSYGKIATTMAKIKNLGFSNINLVLENSTND